MFRFGPWKAMLLAALFIPLPAAAQVRAGDVDSLFGLARSALPKVERSLSAGDAVFIGLAP